MSYLRSCSNCIFAPCNRTILNRLVLEKKISVWCAYHCKGRCNGFVCDRYVHIDAYD